jgi:hypothetical protein
MSSANSLATASTYSSTLQTQLEDLDRRELALAIARNREGLSLDINAFCEENDRRFEEVIAALDDPAFCRLVNEYRAELRENGYGFVAKARMQAEQLLLVQYEMIHNPDVPPAVKEKMIANTVRWARYEPKNEESVGSGNVVAVNINLG